jgi:dTDP-4-dehydrorhamnose 3,5-epimerase-like enzyme
MANIIDLKTHTDTRGNLTVVEKVLPFDIKRVFYIYGVDDSIRGNHRHKKTIQAAICLRGTCRIQVQDGPGKPMESFELSKPSECLLLKPEDYHSMDRFSPDCILMVFASEYYDAADYIFEPYL